MDSVNKVILIGRLGADAELKYTPAKTPVSAFRLAISKKIKDEEQTTWVRCNLFGKRAEALNQYLKKGNPIYVEGELTMRKWKSKEGHDRESTEIFVQDVQLLGGKSRQEPVQEEFYQDDPSL